MAQIESHGGMLTLSLEEGERIRVTAGSHVLLISRGSDGALTTTLRSGGEPGVAQEMPARERAPLGIGTPAPAPVADLLAVALSAPDAVREIMLVFEQANVKLRRAKGEHAEESPEQASAMDVVKTEAMDQVVELCRRYTQPRSIAIGDGE